MCVQVCACVFLRMCVFACKLGHVNLFTHLYMHRGFVCVMRNLTMKHTSDDYTRSHVGRVTLPTSSFEVTSFLNALVASKTLLENFVDNWASSC